jgi:hypothetical protein
MLKYLFSLTFTISSFYIAIKSLVVAIRGVFIRDRRQSSDYSFVAEVIDRRNNSWDVFIISAKMTLYRSKNYLQNKLSQFVPPKA